MRMHVSTLRSILAEICQCELSQQQQTNGDDGLKLLQHSLAALRVTYLMHQQSHWEVSGDSFYGDHQLLQRLYEMAQADVDALAERMVGLYGNQSINGLTQLEELVEC